MSDAVLISLITGMVSIVLAIVTSLFAWLSKRASDNNSRKLEQTNATVLKLETNTNSITTQLVELTGRSEFAKGLKEGTDVRLTASDHAQDSSAAQTALIEHQLERLIDALHANALAAKPKDEE